MIEHKTGGTFAKVLILALLGPLALSGCITFGAGTNVGLSEDIQEKWALMQSAAEAQGIDVDGLVSEGAPPEGPVDQLLVEAHTIAEDAEEIAAQSLAIERANFDSLNEAALQEKALNSIELNLNQFEQASAWVVSETQRLANIDRNIVALDGYMDCDGAALGQAKCVVDTVGNISSIANFVGISIPGGQALAAASFVFLIAGEIDRAVQRGQLFDQRDGRIAAIQAISSGYLEPSFENLKGTMSTALNRLPPELQPPDWEAKLVEAEARVQSVVAFTSSLDGRLEQIKERISEEKAALANLGPGILALPEEERNRLDEDTEVLAFQEIWAEINTMTDDLTAAMVAMQSVRDDLRNDMERRRSVTVDDQGVPAVDGETYKTALIREQTVNLQGKLERMEEIEGELAGLLPNYQTTGGNVCPVAL